MSNQIEKDRELSFSIINYLSASYRGKLAGYTVLGQVQHPSFDEAEIAVIHHSTDRISEWLSLLHKGETMFSVDWETPETFEAQNALGLLEKLKPELNDNASKIKLFLEGKEKIDKNSAKWLFSMLIRSAYARDVYLRGFVMFGETFNKPQLVEGYGNLLSRATQHTNLIQQGLAIFKEAEYDLGKLGEGFLMSLLSGCEELPSVFRTHVQDINLLTCHYKGGVNFENTDFEKEEASEWLLAGISPSIAGYWRAYGFTAQESLKWLTNFVNDPAEAEGWKGVNFSPEAARPWKELSFSFPGAMLWHQAGYQPAIAKEYIEKGIFEPPILQEEKIEDSKED